MGTFLAHQFQAPFAQDVDEAGPLAWIEQSFAGRQAAWRHLGFKVQALGLGHVSQQEALTGRAEVTNCGI